MKKQTVYEEVNTNLNLVLGALPEHQYTSGSFMLEDNNRLFLYTDGVTEAQTKTMKMFGTERLQNALNKKNLSLAATLEQVHKSIKAFIKGAPQFDDITMMVIEFHQQK